MLRAPLLNGKPTKADKRHNQFDEFKSVDNSTDFQVFVPGSFDHYNPAAKGKIQQAVDETAGQYLFFRIISINRGRLGRGAEDVSLKNQELMS